VFAAVRSVTGRLVAVFGLVLSLVLAALALYVGRSERASILAGLDNDLATVSALLANRLPSRPLPLTTAARSTRGPIRTAARSAGASPSSPRTARS